MFLKNIDFLSPSITLFYQGNPAYSSPMSGFLTIITCILIALCSIPYLKILFNRNAEVPNSTSFTKFIEDAGTFPLNSSALFHFISIEEKNNKENEEFDFSEFNAIGVDGSISNYESDRNINNYNHWLYGYCNNDKDIEGLNNINNHNYLAKSACIRKYYDKNTKQYYDTDNPNFIWPNLSHGTFHPKNIYYSLIIKSCEQKIINILFSEENINCKNEQNFNLADKVIHMNFVDRYVDITKYKNPTGIYAFRLENKLDTENYSVNHMNFNPVLIKSNNGIVLDADEIELSYAYERTDVFTYRKKADIYMAYSFYLNNRLNYYERAYSTLQDVLSSIGGVLNIIIFIMTLINDFFNSYIVLHDFNFLLYLFSITRKDIEHTNRRNIVNKKLRQLETINKNNCPLTKESSSEELKKVKEKEENEKIKEKQEENEEKKAKENDLDTINSESLETEKSDKFVNVVLPKGSEEIEIKEENQDNKNDKEIKENKDDLMNFGFWDFFLYKITFGKKNSNLELYEEFRKKVLSVENLTQNYLKMNNLIGSGRRISKISEKNKYID